VHGGRGEPVVEHAPVEGFDVLGLEPVEAVLAQAGDGVEADVAAVPGQGAFAHGVGGDVVQPVGKPRVDGGGAPGGGDAPGLAGPFEAADLGEHLALGGG
jgi:hypothetical protein